MKKVLIGCLSTLILVSTVVGCKKESDQPQTVTNTSLKLPTEIQFLKGSYKLLSSSNYLPASSNYTVDSIPDFDSLVLLDESIILYKDDSLTNQGTAFYTIQTTGSTSHYHVVLTGGANSQALDHDLSFRNDSIYLATKKPGKLNYLMKKVQ